MRGSTSRFEGGRDHAAAPIVLALITPAVLVLALRGSPLDVLFQSATFHLVVVSGIAACALVIAAVAARQAAGVRRASLVPLALGALAVGVFMLGHGLVTPGILGRPGNLWVARLPIVAIAGFAIGLALVHRFPDTRLRGPVARRWLLGGLAAMTIPTVAIVLDPTVLGGGAPFPGEQAVSDGVSVLVGASMLQTGLVHHRRWRLSGSHLQLAMTMAAWLGTSALVALQLGALWRLSWWDYHAFLLAGFGSAVIALVLARRESASIDEVLDQAFETDPFAHIVSGYPDALLDLIAAVEAKDRYTFGHSARVAELSVRLGLELGMSSDALRGLARGAYLHDVGKIAVPDAILNKPGRLDEAERARIEEHPETGAELVGASRRLHETLGVIRHHHERMDGNGYPDGLRGDAIPIAARVCAVADVWDALTSDRAYRDAMTPTAALGHIVAGSGTHFDPRAVEALVRHLGAGALRPDEDGDEAVAAVAAHACHETP